MEQVPERIGVPMTLGDLIITVVLMLIYFAWMNYWTYEGFRQDKVRSERGEWRIPEYALLRWAGRGGAPAAFYARRKLRHKTRKVPFSTQLKWLAFRQAIWVPCVLVGIFWFNPVGWLRQNEVVYWIAISLRDVAKTLFAMVA